MEVKTSGSENIDRIPMVDKDLEAERSVRRGTEEQSPLTPINPLTGSPAELLPKRPKGSRYPGRKPPMPMPLGGAKDD